MPVKKRNIAYLADNDEKLARSLAAGGICESGARVLIFLDRHSGATSREIEQGTDMSQPQMSLILAYMKEQAGLYPKGDEAGARVRSFS